MRKITVCDEKMNIFCIYRLIIFKKLSYFTVYITIGILSKITFRAISMQWKEGKKSICETYFMYCNLKTSKTFRIRGLKRKLPHFYEMTKNVILLLRFIIQFRPDRHSSRPCSSNRSVCLILKFGHHDWPNRYTEIVYHSGGNQIDSGAHSQSENDWDSVSQSHRGYLVSV